jgi:hypothetical protein
VYYKRTDSRHNSVNESIYLKIQGSELLSPLADIFLSGKTKIMPLDFAKYLSPIALASPTPPPQLVLVGGEMEYDISLQNSRLTKD